MRFSTHLIFDGQCREAFEFYATLLDAKIVTMLKFGESPLAEKVPPEWQPRILHATLERGSFTLFGSDAFPDGYVSPRGFSVTLGVDGFDQTKKVFDALSDAGRILLPLQRTFWSGGFGMLIDRFGIPWEINCEQPAGVS
ncbi:MAG TPA: VOC family protein [Steroidobacteraceae bacterium]|nr:VOC family protein [Steroidobacteraceae bacterium]